jgi:hypothetical protein
MKLVYRIEIQDYSAHFHELRYKGSSREQDYSGKPPSSTDKHLLGASGSTGKRSRRAVNSVPFRHGWRPCSLGDRFQTDGSLSKRLRTSTVEGPILTPL